MPDAPLQALQRRRESIELRSACEKAGQACCLTIERSKDRRRPQMKIDMDLGRRIAQLLAGSGFSTFVIEAPRDTAPKTKHPDTI